MIILHGGVKKRRRNVRRVLDNADKCAAEIQEMLMGKTYQPAKYWEEKIWDGGANKKERVIYKPKYYPDQVIHWCLIQQIEFILRRGMYYYSCASIPGERDSFCIKSGKEMVKKKDRKHTKYCLQMDIRKFYPSIDREILKELFRKRLRIRILYG